MSKPPNFRTVPLPPCCGNCKHWKPPGPMAEDYYGGYEGGECHKFKRRVGMGAEENPFDGLCDAHERDEEYDIITTL